MNELAQDLTQALEESSKALECVVKRHNRKRKGKTRRSSTTLTEDLNLHAVDFPNRSEASAQSEPEQDVYKYIQVLPEPPRLLLATHPMTAATTDSEDQCSKITSKLSALTLPTANHNSLVSGADPESDSMTEISEERKCTAHARRRRRAKLNASPLPMPVSCQRDMCVTPTDHERKKPKHTRKSSKDVTAMETESLTMSKRKRKSQRRQSETLANCHAHMENSFDNASESSFLTSDGEHSGDERAGEADDEQSDFFHEPEQSCSIPGVRWWDDNSTRDQLQRLISGSSYPDYVSLSHLAYKRTMLGKYGRPFRTGRRRLKHGNVKKPSVPQESSSDSIFCPPPVKGAFPEKEAKRRRKYTPSHYAMDQDGSHLSNIRRYGLTSRDGQSSSGLAGARRRRRTVSNQPLPPRPAPTRASST